MSLSEEYKNQTNWRNWESYIEKIPIERNDTILDLGCGIGFETHLLAKKALNIIGIDNNPELLKEAKTNNNNNHIHYINADLKNLKNLNLPLADGIWTSFVVAYFPDLSTILNSWLSLLKKNGWIAIVEISDLFAHFPLELHIQNVFKQYYERQRMNKTYDFEMGSKIKTYLNDAGVKIIFEENIIDKELSFDGPAETQILFAWEKRLDRMVVMQDFLGKDIFTEVKNKFLECLKSEKHTCKTEVKFIIGRKN